MRVKVFIIASKFLSRNSKNSMEIDNIVSNIVSKPVNSTKHIKVEHIVSKRKSIWKKPLRSPITESKSAPTAFYRTPAPPPPDPIEPPSDPIVEPPKSRLDPPSKRRRTQRSKSSKVKARTHTVTFSISREEHKLFKAKTREMKTSFSALVRTALYHYLDMDPLERPK